MPARSPTNPSRPVQRSYEVAIIGAGPAGASAALFLLHARPDLQGRVAVIDKARFPREKICAGAIGGRADRALQAIGVHIDVPSVPVFGLSVRTRHGSLITRRRQPIGRVVRRKEFDAALARELSTSGADLIEGHALEQVHRSRDRLHLTFANGAELEAGLVVGADGVGSVVRKRVGEPRGRLMAQAVEVDTPSTPGDPDPGLLHFDVRNVNLRGYAWDFPTIVDGERLVCRGVYAIRGALDEWQRIGLSPKSDPRAGLDVSAELRAHLERCGLHPTQGDDGKPRRYKRFAERGLSPHEAFGRDRVVLIGEAAGIDPILGEGIAQAILYGKALGDYLATRLRGGPPRIDDWPRAFARSRVGWDLAIRSRLVPIVYDTSRPLAEHFVTRSQAFADAGIEYFAGDPVPRLGLMRAALDLPGAIVAWWRD